MMFAVLFIVLIVEVSTSTFDSLDYECLYKKNITFYDSYDRNFDFNPLIYEIESQFGHCSTVNIFNPTIQRSVSVETHNAIEQRYISSSASAINLQMISDGIETSGVDRKQQILIYISTWDYNKDIYDQLKMLQEKGWVVIVSCYLLDCKFVSWLPTNRFFAAVYPVLKEGRHNRETARNLIDVLKNPLFDRVKLAMKIKLKNFDRSCFSKQRRDVVIHLVVDSNYNSIGLLRNAMITVSQFPNQEVKFVLYGGSNLRFLQHFTKYYRIHKKEISFKTFSLIYTELSDILNFKKYYFVSTKRNIFLFVQRTSKYQNTFIDQFCSVSTSQIKDIHLYSSLIYDKPLRQCDWKRLPNIHEIIDLYKQEHFVNTINDLVCEKSNDKQKDEF